MGRTKKNFERHSRWPSIPKPETKPRNEGYILVTGGTEGHKLLFDTIAKSNLKNVFYKPEKLIPNHGMTILETLVYRKPMVVVPNPEWTRTAGIEDARYLAKKVNAVLVSEITLKNILGAIEEAKRREFPTLPDGSAKLADLILKL